MVKTSMAPAPAHDNPCKHLAGTIEIRNLSIDDYDAVRALWQSVMPGSLSEADSRDGIRRFLERNPSSSLVAVQGDAIVGAVLGGHDGRRGWIHHLAVAERARRAGIGKKLLTECLKRLGEAGIDKCHVLVFTSNAAGNGFWRAIGATERRELLVYSLRTR
jgi:N-acetylglutamate synthase